VAYPRQQSHLGVLELFIGGEVLCRKLIYRSACTIKHGEWPEGRGFASFSRII